jgi:hypothetical protein
MLSLSGFCLKKLVFFFAYVLTILCNRGSEGDLEI